MNNARQAMMAAQAVKGQRDAARSLTLAAACTNRAARLRKDSRERILLTEQAAIHAARAKNAGS